MKVSHTWLQRYFKDTLPSAEKITELFTFHSFEIDGIEVFDADSIIDAKILPDRAHYCLSHKGIAEELHVLTGMEYTSATTHQVQVEDSITTPTIHIEDENFCRRYIARRIEIGNIKEINETKIVESQKNFLESVGGRSINPIVDATNFVMFDIGQPLHAFDADLVKGTINVRAANDGETILLLDGREITLTPKDFVIADEQGPLALAGVKGGKRAEVSDITKNIIIESANFHPVSVRKTSTKYNVRNESSKRFENEITPELAYEGMEKVTALIKNIYPTTKIGPIIDFYPHPIPLHTIQITTDFICNKLGMNIPEQDITNIFKRLNIAIEKNSLALTLTIPPHRIDLRIPEDIVEEVGRIYGYDKIQGTKQNTFSENISAHKTFYITEQIKNILIEQGFSESYLYSLVSYGDLEVVHPLASDKKALRSNLSEGMAKALDINIRSAELLFLDSIKMFEIGKVFTKDREYNSLCIGIKYIKKIKGRSIAEDIKNIQASLLKALHIDGHLSCTTNTSGEIIEIDLDALISQIETPSYESLGFVRANTITYKPFSPYPFIVRDIAIFVPNEIQAQEIEDIITNYSTNLLVAHKLFDTFKKEDKTSFAFRMIFQSYERTLTDEEVNTIMDILTKKIKEKGWEVR